MPGRPFRFGVQASFAASAGEWRESVERIESAGYTVLGITDHLYGQLAPFPALAAAGACSTRLELGVTVLANDFRHPAMLAKELATLDLLTGGRTFIGIGAGWLRSDYDEAGLRFDPPAERIERLAEAVAVLKGLFADGPFSFEGRHYRVAALDGLPKPLRRPHPPLLIGGGGRRILSFAAREADIVGVNVRLDGGVLDDYFAGGASGGPFDEKIGWVREAAGDRFDDLELNTCLTEVIVTDDAEKAAAAVATRYGVGVAAVLETPQILIGSVAAIADTLLRRRDRYGISLVLVPFTRLEDFAPVAERLAGR